MTFVAEMTFALKNLDLDLSLESSIGIYHMSILLHTIYTVALSIAALVWNFIRTKSVETTIAIGWGDLLGPVSMGVFHCYMLLDKEQDDEESIIPDMINGFNAIVGTLGSLAYLGLGVLGLLQGFDVFIAISYIWSSASSIYYMLAV